ncbi:MAG: glycosyltransferase family 9 protein [Lentisphaeria bacterium]|nr:glycosyltransferase family 9 protein [Lentisphaeria bacterium]
MRILVIKPSSFGDIVHLFPALALMREKFPAAELDFVVNPEFAPLLDFSPFPVRRKIIFERRKLASWRFLPELCSLRRELRKEYYDVTIDFQGLFRSGYTAHLSRSKMRVGFAGSRERSAEIFYDRKIAVSPVHAVERYAALVKELFEIDSGVIQPDLPVNESARCTLPELPEKYIALLPGTRWESKRFPPEFFGNICREIRREHPEMAFVAAGSAGERAIAGKIGENVINMAGETTLPQLFELLRNACAVIGNDSGPLHAAAALKRPVFGFYGATDPVLTGPWGKNCRFYFADCECAGCLKRICPDGSYRCWQMDARKIAGEISDVCNREEQICGK